MEDGYERETNVAPLLETNDFCGTGTNGGDDGAAGLDDNRLVPLLDPRGHGVCPGWWCERCGAFCFFFTVCTASLIASAATMAVCVADTGSMVVVYSFLAPEFQILKPQTTFAYRFNHTLNDLVWSSWVRTFLALASHAASRLDNLYTPYLFVSATLLAVCGVHAGLKAHYFDYGGNEVDKTIAPIMFAITITACLAHVAVAFSMRVHARKKAQEASRHARRRARVPLLGNRRTARLRRPRRAASTAIRTRAIARRRDRTTGHEKTRVSQIRLTGTSPRARWRTSTAGSRRSGASGSTTRIRWRARRIRSRASGTAGGRRVLPPGRRRGLRARLRRGAFCWRKIAPSLATTLGVRVICLDRPGFGFSARPGGGSSPRATRRTTCSSRRASSSSSARSWGWSACCSRDTRTGAWWPCAPPPRRRRWPRGEDATGGGGGRRRVSRAAFTKGSPNALPEEHEPSDPARRRPLAAAAAVSASSVSREPSEAGGALAKKSGSRKVRIAGLALLGADARLDAAVPAPVRLLLNTKLGETMLRPLLRTEIGEVANRRAWFDRSKLNGETLRLYRLPLCIEGWDGALMEAARTRQKMTQRDVAVALEALKDTPTLMVTGADDVVAPPTRAIAVAAELRRCALKILPRCGHLPHEESPRALLEALRPFVLETLQRGRGRQSLEEEL